MNTPQPGKWVCLSYDEKRRLARLVSPLSFAERQFRLPILRQRENYTETATGSKPEKAECIELASSCIASLTTGADTISHPCADL
jgi:hypothetical protein